MRPFRRGSPLLRGVAAVLVLTLGAGSLAAAGETDLAGTLGPIRARSGIPAIAAAVIRDGKIVARGVVGVRALGSEAPARLDDRFLIGSCAKSMLRILVARLVDAGAISFETTLGQALTDTPMREVYRNVSMAQLLQHRGGIQPYTRIGPRMTPWLFELKGSPAEQRAAFASHVLNEEPAATPGGEEIYSNAGYGVAAHVVESLAGTTWEELLATEVFAPLGMSTAIIGLPTSAEDQNGPRGHFRGDTGYELTPGWREPLPALAPAGMVSCSITDFARFAGALARSQSGGPDSLLTPATAARIRDLMPPDANAEGIPFLGGEGTFTAAFAIWPSRNLAIVVQTNGGSSDDVCTAAIEAARAAVAPEVPASVPPFNRNPHGVSFVDHAPDDWEVAGVTAGSTAARAGLKPGDRLLKLNGAAIDSLGLRARVEALRAGKVTLSVRRNNQLLEFELVTPAGPPKQ